MSPIEPARPNHFRLSIVLGALGAFSTILVLPYLMALMPEVFKQAQVPFPVLATAQALQAFIFFSLMAYAGLRLGAPLGLDAPLLRAWVDKQPIPAGALRGLRNAAVMGAILGGLIVVLDWATQFMLPQAILDMEQPAWWKGLLASFYGAIAEETQVRLFFMTLMVWVAIKVLRREAKAQDYWLAIIIAAALFGLGHLPAAAQLAELTPEFVLRTVALNMVVGIPCGWLFWRYGLEYAMAAHFAADIVLHVLMALA